MGNTFNSHGDAPDKLRQEGEELVIKFDRNGTTGTVTWQIPPPANGCNADDQAYNGIVIVLNTVANSPTNWPVDGTVYTGDPIADADLHAGDTINGALVIGAFYDDKTTVSLDVSGLLANTAYFITGHIVDNVYRYHKQGISAYSLPHLYTEPQDDQCAYQEITLGGTTVGTDATGLTPGTLYTVDLQVDTIQYQLTIDGANAQTYDELVDALSAAIELLENPFQGATAPNTGAYWYDATAGKLWQWNGSEHIEIAVIKEADNPTVITEGEYWLDGNNILYRRENSPLAWIEQTPIRAGYDPASPPCDVFWAQTVNSPATVSRMWEWDGSVWCKRTTFFQEKDPSCAPDLTCGSYWYDETNEMLFVWNEDTESWDQTEGIAWHTDPTSPAIGTYWFDDATNTLYERTNVTTWTERAATVSEDQPSFATVGDFWFVPSLQELFTFTVGSPEWAPTAVLIWDTDPTIAGSCDLWWNTSTSPQTLNVWDAVNNSWTPVVSFTISSIDPALAQTITTNSVWVQTGGTSFIFWQWDGSQFVQINATDVAVQPTDPTDISAGDVWNDTANNVYYERDAGQWVEIDVIESIQDPTMLTVGTFWYNETDGTLNMWNGATWVNIMFSTSPLYPVNGTLWYNTSTETLLEWNSSPLAWVSSTPLAVVTMNDSRGCEPNGNIIIATSQCGSFGNILIGTVDNTSNLTTFITTDYKFTGSLFPALGSRVDLKPNKIGVDGLTGIPSYDTIGVGTDGTADERRELADSIRIHLGHPTVTVELTKAQLNEAITKALEALRLRSSAAYRRVYFFLDAKEGIQNYLLTNERVGFHKVVTVMGMWRITSAFMSTVHAAGVYGQTILQHLYHMGTYDLVSYHLISDYIEQLEQLFATRIVFTWDESSRELFIFQRFTRDERILVDSVIERTEQEILTNRMTKTWIERWASAEARLMLAEIRGKYATLPGAGGGVALNAADLVNRAELDFARCDQEIDDYVVNDVENLGIGSEFIIG